MNLLCYHTSVCDCIATCTVQTYFEPTYFVVKIHGVFETPICIALLHISLSTRKKIYKHKRIIGLIEVTDVNLSILLDKGLLGPV